MKQIAVIALLGFFVFDAVGFYFLVDNRIYSAKSEAQRMIRSGENDLITITVSKTSDLQPSWTGSHEFRYGDEMYDVIRVNEEANKVIYLCFQDEKEYNLISDAHDQFTKKTGQGSPDNLLKPAFNLSDKYCPKNKLPFIQKQIIFCFSHMKVIFHDDLFHRQVPTPPPNKG